MIKGFFDEHFLAWLKHMRSGPYPVSGYRQTCLGGPITERTFGSSVVKSEIVLKYDV